MANENNRLHWLKQVGGRTRCSKRAHKAPALGWAEDAMWIPVALEDIFRKGSCWSSGGQEHALHLNRNGSSMEMCMCMHVTCVHVCMYACTYVCVHGHARAYAHMCAYQTPCSGTTH